MAKVALVTGTNRGLGYAITKRLCKEFQGTVIMTARDEKKGNEVCEQLHQDGCKTVFHQLDITSQESINKLRNFLEEKYGALDILINNSGIMFKGASTLPYHEQAEQSVNTNFFGTLNMCKTFFPLLQPHARVVNVSSVYGVTSIVGEDLQRKFASPKLTVEGVVALMEQYVGDAKAGRAGKNGWPVPGQIVVPAYAVSKLGVTALSAAQARKMKNDPREDIIVNSVCPGWCRTDMGGQNAPRRAERGAKTPVYCALLPSGTTSPNGDFVKDEKIYPWMQSK